MSVTETPIRSTSAKKLVKGCLLWSPVTNRHFFRVYESADKKKFTDYELGIEDIDVVLLDPHNTASLFKSEDHAWVGWSSSYLGTTPEKELEKWKPVLDRKDGIILPTFKRREEYVEEAKRYLAEAKKDQTTGDSGGD